MRYLVVRSLFQESTNDGMLTIITDVQYGTGTFGIFQSRFAFSLEFHLNVNLVMFILTS